MGGERPHDGRRRELLLAAHDGDAVGVGEVERDAGDVLVLRVVAPLPLRHHRVAARLVGEVPLLPALLPLPLRRADHVELVGVARADDGGAPLRHRRAPVAPARRVAVGVVAHQPHAHLARVVELRGADVPHAREQRVVLVGLVEQEHEALADRRHVRERRARPLGVQRRRADELLLGGAQGVAGERAAAEPAVGVADEDGGAVGGVRRAAEPGDVGRRGGRRRARRRAPREQRDAPDASAASICSGADGLHCSASSAPPSASECVAAGACAPRSSPATS